MKVVQKKLPCFQAWWKMRGDDSGRLKNGINREKILNSSSGITWVITDQFCVYFIRREDEEGTREETKVWQLHAEKLTLEN